MFKNVVVGVDGRDGGLDAIALGKLLVAPDGELTFAYVYHGDPHAWHGSVGVFDADAQKRAREVLEPARAGAGIKAHVRWRGAPSVGRGLHEMAEVIGADLLVIGSSRRGLIGRVLARDDTRAALNGAPCAVAIAPARYDEQPAVMREIGVGYDESPESEHALEAARTLAAEHHSRLSAFQVVTVAARDSISGQAIDDLISAAQARIAALGDIEPHASYGDPAEELALYGASLDLLVVGSRGFGPLGRLMHGSTSVQLTQGTRCPLLVLTRAGRATQDDGDDSRRGVGHRKRLTTPARR